MTIPRCRVCGEPIVFVLILGWQHLSIDKALDHPAEEAP